MALPPFPQLELILDGRASLGDVNSRSDGKPKQVAKIKAASDSQAKSR
jgi:hypothetical protein